MAKATILLVQNAKTHGNGTKRHLERTGFNVIWTGSGVAALAAAKKQVVDLIVLDSALPDIAGTDLCRLFRSRERTSTIPILLLTESGYTPEPSNGKASGPDDYLATPCTESELDARIAAVLGTKTPAEGPATERVQPLLPNQSAPQTKPGAETSAIPTQERLPLTTPEPEAGAPPAVEPAREQGALPARELSPAATPPQAPEKPAALETTARPAEPTLPLQRHSLSDKAPPPASEPADHHPAGAPLPAPTGNEIVDATTGLFNRSQFDAMFSKEFKRSMRFKQQMSCMLIDLDGRKMGREGDVATLKEIVKLVQQTIREVDTAAWWSGEALIVLLPNTIRNDAVQAAARILEVVAKHPFTWSDSAKVTMSIGVAGLPNRKIDTEQKLIEAAASACKRARDFV